jgi:hypothetical protein
MVDEADEDKKRRSNKARQKILQIIVEQGFNGEVHADMEKEFVKKKRFKVFALTKKSDLESKLMVRPSGAYRTAKQDIKNTCVVSSLAVQVFKRCRER